MASTTHQNTKKRVEIDFMFLDLDVCMRCRNTDSNLEAALDTVGSILQSAGVEVLVRKKLVDSERKAMELGFVSSPTIRVNGRDIALEFRESSCASCGEACACEGNIDCRVWVYQSQEYTAAPEPMIVDAILAAVYGTMEAVQASVQVAPVPVMTDLNGLTQREAAERSGLSFSGMKSRVQRGRQQLKEVLLECCRIEFDCRGGIVGYAQRDAAKSPCGQCGHSEPKS